MGGRAVRDLAGRRVCLNCGWEPAELEPAPVPARSLTGGWTLGIPRASWDRAACALALHGTSRQIAAAHRRAVGAP